MRIAVFILSYWIKFQKKTPHDNIVVARGLRPEFKNSRNSGLSQSTAGRELRHGSASRRPGCGNSSSEPGARRRASARAARGHRNGENPNTESSSAHLSAGWFLTNTSARRAGALSG